ncbi:MAG: hypothetical protein ACRER2_10400 [Methylococcales bacterium]
MISEKSALRLPFISRQRIPGNDLAEIRNVTHNRWAMNGQRFREKIEAPRKRTGREKNRV